MKLQPMGARKLGLYTCTVLASVFIWWVGTALMNEFTGALGTILRLFAVALPVWLVAQEMLQQTKKAKEQSPPAKPDLAQPSGRTPLHALVRTWRNMASASVLAGVLMYVTATGLPWHVLVIIPLLCLAGPFSLLLNLDAALRVLPPTGVASTAFPLPPFNPDALSLVAVYVVLYGAGVAWLFWKPSPWARAAFYVFSVLWWLMGLSMASVGVDGGSSLFL